MKNLSEIIPTNATEALRLARTNEKAKAILTEGYTFELHPEIKVVTVCKPNQPYATYFINLSDTDAVFSEGCSCPDYQNRGEYCKHILAYETLKAEERAEEKRLVQREDELEAESCEMSLESYLRWKELSEEPFVR